MSDTFALDIQRFVNKVGANAEVVVRKVAIDLFGDVIKASPVDTGRFRANWNTSIGNPDTATSEDVDPTGEKATAAVAVKTGNFALGEVIYLTNALPYAHRLEYDGWSRQAPIGMVRVNVTRWQSYITSAVAKLP